MSVETRDQQEFQRYLEYQQSQRPAQIETLGGAATALFLSTIDMGVTDARDPAHEASTAERDTEEPFAEVVPLRATRQRRLAEFATEFAELGYADAA